MLKKLDLLWALLDTKGYCTLIRKCPNLEVLRAEDVIGDKGMEVVAQSCKRLKRLRVECYEAGEGSGFEEVLISENGLMAIAQGCPALEYIAFSVRDITNQTLECLGTYSKNLCDFRLKVVNRGTRITDMPLDNGVRALLRGCERLRKLSLFLQAGGLTDLGMSYLGQYSPKIRSVHVRCVRESDQGLLELAKGCPSLQKLKVADCCFSEKAVAQAAKKLTSLTHLWVWRKC